MASRRGGGRRPKADDQHVQMQVPSDQVARIIGKQGANVKRLAQLYDISIDTSLANNSSPVSIITIVGQNVAGAQQDIMQMISGGGGGGAAGGFGAGAAGGFGGGAAGGFGAAGGGDKHGAAFVFRLRGDGSRQIELLLEHIPDRGWTVPSGRLNQPSDLDDNCRTGVFRILSTSCGGGDAPLGELVPLESQVKTSASPVQLSRRSLHHLLVPPEPKWEGWYPSPLQAGVVSDAPLVITGTQVAVQHGHAWVPLAALQAEISSRATPLNKDVVNWFSKNAAAILPLIDQAYGGNTTALAAVPPSPVAGVHSPAVEPGWVARPEGQQLIGNLKFIVDTMHGFDEGTFVSIVDKVFNPHHLRDLCAKWAEAGGQLPNAV